MPCYDNRDSPENQILRQPTEILAWLLTRIKEPHPKWLTESLKYSSYNKQSVPTLCALLKAMEPKARETLIYGDAKDPMRRKLADWWEQHQRIDALHEKAERAQEAAERKEYERLKRKFGP